VAKNSKSVTIRPTIAHHHQKPIGAHKMAQHEPTPQSAIDEWLAKGNKIIQCAPGERSGEGVIGYTHGWGRKKKPIEVKPEESNKEE